LYQNQHALKLYLKKRTLTADSDEGKRSVITLIESEVNEYRTNGKFPEICFQTTLVTVAIGILGGKFY